MLLYTESNSLIWAKVFTTTNNTNVGKVRHLDFNWDKGTIAVAFDNENQHPFVIVMIDTLSGAVICAYKYVLQGGLNTASHDISSDGFIFDSNNNIILALQINSY